MPLLPTRVSHFFQIILWTCFFLEEMNLIRLVILISSLGLLTAYISPRFRFRSNGLQRAGLIQLQMSDIMADDGGFPEDNEESLPETDADQEEDDSDQAEEDKDDDDEEDELDDELDGLRLEALDNLSAMDIDDGDDGDDEDYIGESDDDVVDGVVKKVTRKRGLLTERRAKKKADLLVKKKEGRSWEEKFVDDPLKADEPTVVLQEEQDYFTQSFVVMAMISKGEQVEQRARVWTHHQQWVRRNTLLPGKTKVEREFTMLSNDLMVPVGQMLLIKANTSTEVTQFLTSEPLAANNAIDKGEWSIYELNSCDTEMYENVTNHLRNPYIFVGNIKKKTKWDGRLERESYKYHNTQDRSTCIGTLSDSNNGKPEKFLAIFNSITTKDANRYIQNDPNVMQGMIDHDTSCVYPCNEQDVDGLNHFMARSFGEKEEIDKIHFLDPEELLLQETDPAYDVPENNNLVANRLVLDELAARGISYKYNRYSLEKFKDMLSDKDVTAFNEYMGRSQKTRLESAVDADTHVEEMKPAKQKIQQTLDDDVEA